ncbi:MAG: 50S ribosomal protein L2 [Candidatus Nomurabacteria bacterium GW2011_GWA1_37_20]|uniref:Large ribosomal subunit protein uL2 n=1 Tax=Candidatus Nomurabacteria bacterium GW2011_GWA1_37_20 TaxID=1618729 RepID=A0A0G0J6A8_9BACT|nr:MAG: 50S ribosomal protein L2 [Parcubacteria group bacterium GW2011_GWC1_36_9]KKQ28045.1 MAG: 50S ribosomal protein L2 [Parcubacteria group bacterium GW2011_GWB1_37_13]KKQ32079.1 MAG: 50S ribosomal protein L2 [Candidatus Nomurabacteria bacterium GW2011_GWA1_37_20]
MKTYKPTSKSRRQMTHIPYRELLTHTQPTKSLIHGFSRSVGRNSAGRITVRHKGAGHKRLYREVDFLYNKKEIPAIIKSVEYDPNRSAFIGLAVYKDGEKRYVILPKSVKPGDSFMVSPKAPLIPANRLPLKDIPVGTFVYNIEIQPNGGAKIGRSAGIFAQVVANADGYTNIKMPSTEVRKINENCWASIGTVSNEEHHLENYGKAGRSRWKGIRPTVRGTAMNPVDHPYGGGEGRQGRGTKRPKTMWGKVTGGRKTRGPKRYSNVFIISRRKTGKNK